MGVLKEVWINDIQENLFEGSEFILKGKDHSAFVSNSVVHVPQAGSVPNTEKNRAVFPATITERTDTDLNYPVDSYSTDPVRVRRIDEVQTSYNKRQSVMGDHIQTLNEEIGDNVANTWAADGGTIDVERVFRTTGAGGADVPTGSTQDGKRLVHTDIRLLAKKFDRDNIPKKGRTLVMPPEMYYDLFEGATNSQILRKDYLNAVALPEGVVDRLYDFDIMLRPTVVIFTANSTVKKAVGAAPAGTDVFGAIAFHQSVVSYAKEAIHVYEDAQRPEHYGDVLSAEVLLGAAKLRSDQKGVASLIQGVV